MAIVISFATIVACFAANAQMGTWKLNEAKSKIAPGMGKNTTVAYAEQGDKIKITVEGVDKDRETDARRLDRQMGWKSLPGEGKCGLGLRRLQSGKRSHQ